MSYEFSETDGGHDWTPLIFSEILQFRRCSSRLAPNRGGANCDAEPARRKSHGVDPEASRRRMPSADDGQHGHASEHGLLRHRDNAGGTHPRTPPRIARIPCPELRALASGTESSNPLPPNEALADAGGVFVSNTVHDQVRDRLPFAFEDLGGNPELAARQSRESSLSPPS